MTDPLEITLVSLGAGLLNAFRIVVWPSIIDAVVLTALSVLIMQLIKRRPPEKPNELLQLYHAADPPARVLFNLVLIPYAFAGLFLVCLLLDAIRHTSMHYAPMLRPLKVEDIISRGSVMRSALATFLCMHVLNTFPRLTAEPRPARGPGRRSAA